MGSAGSENAYANYLKGSAGSENACAESTNGCVRFLNSHADCIICYAERCSYGVALENYHAEDGNLHARFDWERTSRPGGIVPNYFSCRIYVAFKS